MLAPLMYCTKCGAEQGICVGCGNRFPKKSKAHIYCKHSCLMRHRRELEAQTHLEKAIPKTDMLSD